MRNTMKIGQFGESLACGYIVKQGWQVLKRNHRERSDEIDIIAKSPDGTLVFCEVKTLLLKEGRIVGGLMPEDNLTTLKLRKIGRACQLFAGKHPELINPEKGWQIDLFAIDLKTNGELSEIRHYENI
jgi:Holliday junction resolvase-like predicted endonuclease